MARRQPQLDAEVLPRSSWRKPRDRCPLPRASLSGCRGWHWSDTAHPGLSGLQSVYERQGIAVMTPTVPGSPKGPFLGLPRGTMRRQKSIGKQRGHPRKGAPWLSAPSAVPLRGPRPAHQRTGTRPHPQGGLDRLSRLKLSYPLDTESRVASRPHKPSIRDNTSRVRGRSQEGGGGGQVTSRKPLAPALRV